MKAITKDWVERTIWLALFAVIGVAIQQVTDLAVWYAPLIMMGLQQLRNLVTRKLGNKDSVGIN